MRDLFSDNNSGYRLNTLQIFNWGVFDKKTVTFSFDDKSTILTGLNGSGKTTTVDAILTLLIPPNKRFYNLSSESSKKRERDEKNYTLGAYGNRADEDGEGVSKYLRKKNEVISILNGIFHEETSGRYLSLLQVRYFSGEELKCLKIITEKELRIEEITLILAENNTQIAQNSKWVGILKDKVGSRLFDSFQQYESFFMDKFGFRSENALKLFSQTVGLKVLGDITSFIRMYMLEDKSPVKEYEQLNSDFAHITTIEKEMRKTEKEIEFLSRVVKNGDEYIKAESEKRAIEESFKGLEGWFILHALRLSGEEKAKKMDEISSTERRIEDNIKKTEENDTLLSSFEKDDRARVIRDLTRAVEEARKEENEKRKRLNQYNEIVTALRRFSSLFSNCEKKEEFVSNRREIEPYREEIQDDKKRLESESNNLFFEMKSLKNEIDEVKREIESLEKRENNIPSDLIALRQRIASELSIPLKRLPFLGELVRVKDKEEEWREGIESLLMDDAILMLLDPVDEKKITAYIEKNNLEEKISFLLREELLPTQSRSDLLDRIEIKSKDNPYKDWLMSCLPDRFPHVFVSDLEELEKNEYALLPSGIIKSGDVIIKDDSVDPFTKKKPQYLGWSNKERLEELNSNLYSMNDELESFSIKMENVRRNINERDIILKNLDNLSSYTLYDEIDHSGAKERLEEKENARKEFLLSNSDMEEIERKIEELKTVKRRLQSEHGELYSSMGVKKVELKTLLESEEKFKAKKDLSENKSAIASFVSLNEGKLKYDDLSSLLILYSMLSNDMKERRDKKNEEWIDKKHRLESSMSQFLNPPRNTITSDIDWSGEFNYLIAEAPYYPDFKDLYIEKKDDDMTSLREDFNSFLEKTLSNVIGTLSEALNSWEKEINEAVRILNRNLMRIPFNKELKSHLRLEAKRSGDKDYQTFKRMLSAAIPDKFVLLKSDSEGRKSIYGEIKKFLDKYNNDEKLKKRVLDIRNNYHFIVYEDNSNGNISTYSDTAALSGGEKAKLTYTILASALCYQYNLDNEDEKRKGPFRFVILDEAFSKSDANNSIYALELFKELDLQLMVVTPRNGINLVEGYINSLHLIEKKGSDNTSSVSSMTIEEYRSEK